jgi:hypothetical protein
METPVLYTNGKVVEILSDPGPKVSRPKGTVSKINAFQRQFIKNGNTIYTANICTFTCPSVNGDAIFELTEHTNSAVNKIAFKGTTFAAPSLSPMGGMCTSAAFNVFKGQRALQKKITERGCEDVVLNDEISDVAADEHTLLVTTKLMSESTPSEKKFGRMNLNDSFVSDVVHTKRIGVESPGVVDYTVCLNIPANYTHGIIEVLSATFFNDVIIQLIKKKDGWAVMKPGRYQNGGFVIASSPEVSMGIILTEWPKGAVMFPPAVCYKEFEEVNRWSVIQQIGSPVNDSVKVPGGRYSWRFKMFFGPIWFVQGKINEIKLPQHGNAHKVLFAEDMDKKRMYDKFEAKRHKHGYPYI